MKLKMHLGFLLVMVLFLGTYLTNPMAPNQQIIVQFSNQQISSEQVEASIEALTEELHKLNVDQLQIGEYNKGQLKIKYYSDSDVIRIKRILSLIDNVVFEFATDTHSNKDESDNEPFIKLNVSEIQNSPINNWDFEGTQISEFNHKSDRYYFPKLKFGSSEGNAGDQKVHQKNSRFKGYSLSIPKNPYDYKIPEVRAGPKFLG
ncbi:hypothetical protein [Winogradskyella alexanderae]|uniref:Uncharacterized protein n=1 Tax=Winogradskyella alexanderae TaxID=2877123 RepID=A0ABS7XWQ3_9FLAO|nr:hypothetical protein [Winogradskyella alexanderae]MCA0133824.1 hypothetical protein [Winogradskyella alexanderae]